MYGWSNEIKVYDAWWNDEADPVLDRYSMGRCMDNIDIELLMLYIAAEQSRCEEP